MKLKITELIENLLVGCSSLCAPEDARVITNSIVECCLTKDARMNPLKGALDDLEEATRNPSRFTVLTETSGVCLLDFCGTSPLPLLPELHRRIKSMAEANGIGAIALKNTFGIHQLSMWVEPLVADLHGVAFFAWNGGSYTTAPFGSMEPFFGTNPIAYAIPTLGHAIVCDMATSEIPFLSLTNALKSGADLSIPAGVNEKGEITSVAKEIYNPEEDGPVRLLPMGLGYKGSAIMLLLEILTGAMIGSKMGREATDEKFIPEEFGGWLIYLKIGTFTDTSSFLKSVTTLCDQIRKSQRMDGVDKITIPGDGSYERKADLMRDGEIEIDEATYARLISFGSAKEGVHD